MNRADTILTHPEFKRILDEIETAERSRSFCGHGREHLSQVARYMLDTARHSLCGLSPSLLCAAAYVHDLGRAEEYRGGRSHEEAGVSLAAPILTDCGFTQAEIHSVLTAIREHRSSWPGGRSPLGALLYEADKRSRPCWACPARPRCNWPPEKQNLTPPEAQPFLNKE